MNNSYSTWISDCGKYTVKIQNTCIEEMIKLGMSHLPNEVGTSLIGSYSEDGYTAFIEDLVPITKDSVMNKFSFIRGVSGLKKFYSDLMKKFNANRYYVGEWHSHPYNTPLPSSIDDKNQFDISKDKLTNCPESILIIVGGNIKEKPSLGVYVYSQKNGKIILTDTKVNE